VELVALFFLIACNLNIPIHFFNPGDQNSKSFSSYDSRIYIQEDMLLMLAYINRMLLMTKVFCRNAIKFAYINTHYHEKHDFLTS